MKVIVDYRNLCKISSYSILSGSVACSFPTETEEIAHRIAKRLYCIRLDYPEADLILADDTPPYWRTAWLNQWYSDHGQEPVKYKGNRDAMSWPFASSKEALNQVYDAVRDNVGNALEARIIADQGLEADDIFAILAIESAITPEKVIGISTDSDWTQLCSPLVSILDPATGETCNAPTDIRIKHIAGDRGDNIPGCNKRKKDGSPGTTNWGTDGAKKLLEKSSVRYYETLDTAVLARNRHVVTLPCPGWNMSKAMNALALCVKPSWQCDAATILEQFGLSANVRKLLSDKAEREAWIAKLRANLQALNGTEKPASVPDTEI